MDSLRAYRGKKVLVTGHTGFKGSWLCHWLLELGADVYGLSRDIPTSPSHFTLTKLEHKLTHDLLDLRDFSKLQARVESIRPDLLIHLAAEAVVGNCHLSPLDAFTSNTLGTVHVLEVLRRSKHPPAAVLITSDKCYQNDGRTSGYQESDRLGGADPYSASKASAELAIHSYQRSYFLAQGVFTASARAGNVIGGGDWGRDRLVPSTVKAWQEGRPVPLRCPHATRPWQHVLEPLHGYLLLGLRLMARDETVQGQAFNFGPRLADCRSVQQLVRELERYWPGNAGTEAGQSYDGHIETTLLQLDTGKAETVLGWSTRLAWDQMAKFTAQWYRAESDTLTQIRSFTDQL